MLKVFTADGREKSKGQSFAPQSVVCSVFLPATQTVTGGQWTKVAMSGKAFDPFGFWDTTNFRFKPTIPGYYRVSAEVLCRPAATGDGGLSAVYKNGVSYRRLSQLYNAYPGSTDIGANGSCLVYLNGTTDYVEIYGWSQSANGFEGTAEYTFADFELVGSSVGVAPEPWHVVGSPGEPAFQNGWVNYDTGTNAQASFYKDPHGVVRVKGLVKNGVINAPVFTLPVGYRPGQTIRFPIMSNGVLGYAVVEAGGNLSWSGGSNAWGGLEPISFRAEQ